VRIVTSGSFPNSLVVIIERRAIRRIGAGERRHCNSLRVALPLEELIEIGIFKESEEDLHAGTMAMATPGRDGLGAVPGRSPVRHHNDTRICVSRTQVQRRRRFLPAWRPLEIPVEVGRDARGAVPVVVAAVIVPSVRFLSDLPRVLFRGGR
jgi:hypothetical protein